MLIQDKTVDGMSDSSQDQISDPPNDNVIDNLSSPGSQNASNADFSHRPSPNHSDASGYCSSGTSGSDAQSVARLALEVTWAPTIDASNTSVSLPTSLVGSVSDSKWSSVSSSATGSSRAGTILPWGAQKERIATSDNDIRPGEFVMRTLFADFTVQAERKMEAVMAEPVEKPLSKVLQRGEDMQFDQLLSALGSVAEHCLPSLLRTLFAWYERQMAEGGATEQKKVDQKGKSIMYIVSGGSAPETVERSEADIQQERRDLAVEFIFCLVLIEVLKQLSFHPGHEDLVNHIEDIAFKHFKYREGIQSSPNAANIHIIADLYAEVIGALAQSRFMSVRKRFMAELKELRTRESSPHMTQSIISLLMGMKFFRVKMVPIEEFEASFQFMQETAQYFLEVKDKDIKHALAGLFVEILVPVAATVKNEVNVPCLKNFVDMLYSQTLDASTKSKHRLALFPLVTCLLCVSQKTFFLQNWHYFLAMCLSHLKNKDPKMCRVALESLYRLLWVYMIRIKCESNSATQSRLQSIVNSLFPKGSKSVVPRDTPLNIFVKIIQFIAQERLDFAMREIVFDLLSVGRPIRFILTPERMSIGLRAFLVVADSLQQKEGKPPMPRTMGVLPSGNTLRVKKTFLNKMLTEDTARSIGMSPYFPHVRRVLVDILRALDVHYGRPLMMTSTQNVNKEPDEMMTGDRKPRIDLFRTCVAAVPRLIPDGMARNELVDLLARLTVHMDEELRALAYQSLQTLVMDFPDWRQDVVSGFTQFLTRDVLDTFPQLVDNGLRMLLQLLNSWKNATKEIGGGDATTIRKGEHKTESVPSVLHLVEAFALVMLCNCRLNPRRLAVHILRDVKTLLKQSSVGEGDQAVIDVIDRCCPQVLESVIPVLPPSEKAAALSVSNIDLQWISDRSSGVWTAGLHEENSAKSSSTLNLCCLDPWATCLFGFLEKDRILSACPTTVSHSWLIVFGRLNSLFSVIDPTPVNDNRASLLRSSAAIRKPVNERDVYLHLWKNYVTFAFRVVPPVPSPIVRCASPDLSLSLDGCTSIVSDIASLSQSLECLDQFVTQSSITTAGRFTLPLSAIRKSHKRHSSSPDSLSAERTDNKSPGGNVSPTALYKLTVPQLRCEVSDVRDAVVYALGKVNADALKDLMEELVPYIREAVDRKQENVRRRRRRDLLRLQLVRVFELIAEYGTFGISSSVLDRDSQSLHPTFVEYMDGARLFLESEPDKEAASVREITLHFCNFIRKMIKSFSLETCTTLLKRELRRNIFMLFSTWSGPYSKLLKISVSGNTAHDLDIPEGGRNLTELQLAALQAMSALLCCGPCFNPQALAEDGSLYIWLDTLMSSENDKVYELGRETVVLLLENNPDIGPLLDWVIDRCYTGVPKVADGCFLALATIFSAKEYPCDHYTAVINVTLMNTGCPRTEIHEIALQLLQVLDKRFFGTVGPLPPASTDTDNDKTILENTVVDCNGLHENTSLGVHGRGTLDILLSTKYCRSQSYLSQQLAELHPELTMPMFSEITHRFQTARPEVRQLLLQYLLPWLHNMELVDPNVPPANPLSYFQYCVNEVSRIGGRREGWGSVEATEMVLNNLFYITAKFGDAHPKEMEIIWGTLCACWPNNLKVIIRYLIIVSGMAPQELLAYAKRVVLYLARARHDRLLDEIMTELQIVETLNCLIERTETPPFYRLISMRKASSHSDGTAGAGQTDSASRSDMGVEKGTIHTKRHSGEDPIKTGTSKSDTALRNLTGFSSNRNDKNRTASGPPMLSDDLSTPTTDNESQVQDDLYCLSQNGTEKFDMPITQPHPLPMPEYGGYFAPLTEYLPDSSQPISGFHRCNVAVMLLTDVVMDGSPEHDWSIHVPLMLHMVLLGLDHTRPLVYTHCRRLLLGLLVTLADHGDHLTVSRVLLNSRTRQLGLGVTTPTLPVAEYVFTEPNPDLESFAPNVPVSGDECPAAEPSASGDDGAVEESVPPVTVTSQDDGQNIYSPEPGADMSTQDVIKSMINFLATRGNQPLWNYEDTTAKVWSIKSAEQLDVFVRHVLRAFDESLPHALISERWAQTALQLGLSCSSRHYAGRSLQVFRSLRVPITSRMLSDVLSRLVETVAEQGEDMQGYVTELLLTLESAVDSLESDFRPLDYMKEIFKSTPNLNNKDNVNGAVVAGEKRIHVSACRPTHPHQPGHARSTSYSVSYCTRKTGSPAAEHKDLRGRTATELRSGCGLDRFSSNLLRSRSAQSLKLLGDSATQDDKMTILAQLFWLSVSLLESDYEHEFLLALRLLGRVLHRLPLDRPDARDKVDKLQSQLRWTNFPGVHALLLKGCTHPNIYEPVVTLLSQFTPMLDLPVVDPSQSVAFPMNVIALLPYLLLNYEDTNELCIRSAENIAQASTEKSKKLEYLGTVMTLYSRRNFSKESFQWTKCVVKYLYDTYSHLSFNMLAFLVEVLEKGPTMIQPPVLSIIHCMLHYVDLASAAAQPVSADLLKVIARHLEGAHWKESLKILKLVVTRSSSLVAPPISSSHWDSNLSTIPHLSFTEAEVFTKKELPGRTMEFTFDLSQTPVIGRRYLIKAEEKGLLLSPITPRRSMSLSPADATIIAGWKRPWMCQGRVRECLVNLLTTCGQRVGLPKSPSDDDLINTISVYSKVIFSQSSDLMERQSSMASSTEEVSGTNNDLSGGSRRDDAAAEQFGVFKDFDFLEYESESGEGESTDNFNWGVRRRPLCEGDQDQPSLRQFEESISEKTPILSKRKRGIAEESSDDEIGSESPLDEVPGAPEFGVPSTGVSGIFPPSSLNLHEHRNRHDSSIRSDTSGSSAGDLGDITPCNASPNLTALMGFRPIVRDDTEETWRHHLLGLITRPSGNNLELFHRLYRLVRDIENKTISMSKESCNYLKLCATSQAMLLANKLNLATDNIDLNLRPPIVWFDSDVIKNTRFGECLKYGLLEIQEHLETFFDRKDTATECLDAAKTSKLHSLTTDTSQESGNDELLLELVRAIYRLQFQLLLLSEALHKMVTALKSAARNASLQDMSGEVDAIQSALRQAFCNENLCSDTEERSTPTPTPSPPTVPGASLLADDLEAALRGLLVLEKWSAALNFVRQNRVYLIGSNSDCVCDTLTTDDDDITIALNAYCRSLIRSRPGVYVICGVETEFTELFGYVFQVSSTISLVESRIKENEIIESMSHDAETHNE